MLYELRTYNCRPGKLPKLLKRFENKTLSIWERQGIKPIGFWTNVIGPSNQQLIYLLAWESMEEREERWNAFMQDPAWMSARDESEKDGPIVANVANAILAPTSFSAMK